MVQKYLSTQRGRFYCILLTFQVFDHVPHLSMFYRLLKQTLHGRVISVHQSMYSKLTTCVQSPQGLTDFFACNLGTRQGCMLSPFLFVMHLNQFIEICNTNCHGVFIDENFANICLILFADDIAQGADLVGRLQHQINVLKDFCNISGMKVNLEKTKIFVFRNGGIERKWNLVLWWLTL